MDTKWLITIVVAQLIAAIVKRLVESAFSRAHKTMKTVTEKARPWVIRFFSAHWRSLVDLAFMVFSLIMIVVLSRSKEPFARGDVFPISLFTCMYFYWQMQLTLDLKRAGYFDAIHGEK